MLIFSCSYGSKSNALNYGAEFLGASIGEAAIGIPSAIVSSIAFGQTASNDNEGWFYSVVMGGITGYLLGSSVGAPLGAITAGKIIHQKGSILSAYIGGITGMILGGMTILGYNNTSGQQNSWPFVITAAGILPPLCSVIGYNLLPHKDNNSHTMFNRNLPQIGVTVLPERYNNKLSTKIGANITFRF